ncbi:MBL fold metallo-hydrolase [Nitrospira moscoviensis]|uniref:Uncharacterized protein n=1 Tax=Nitrospira moscoviensis TaxID=42253 RepID=A0A0K2GDX4_NITMO|nr:MBL fold metallo-hydrolase [Nitrospira moscoviensis]ALA59054.1 hypothetical protein NITMOv2_2641 [Nitrospira moscoviensis]
MRPNSLTFINHASVLITGERRSILTDPWYEGEAFHRGWRLLYENRPEEIERVLDRTDFIWISHEHPDHFSIGFFRKYRPILLDRKIAVLFQHTKDKRVLGFMKKSGLECIELPTGVPFALEDGFTVRIVKDEFYDSALLAHVGGKRVFNLNDCPLHSDARLAAFRKTYGPCDLLLTQFSYAAWKGGRDNVQWRRSAADDKLAGLVRQARALEAAAVVPFASFVYFANVLNSYLNDAVNTPRRVLEFCREAGAEFTCVLLKPMESLDLGDPRPKQREASVAFWEGAFQARKSYIRYAESIPVNELSKLFRLYCERLKKRNSWWLIRLCRAFGLAFKPVVIKLIDTGDVVCADVPRRTFGPSALEPEIALHSESLAFILKFPYGFDTLAVNGNFEELKRGGFGTFTKTFALENLNNIGYSFSPALALNFNVVRIFTDRLTKASNRLNAGAPAPAPDAVGEKAA